MKSHKKELLYYGVNSIVLRGHIHRLAGFVPSGSRRPPGREKLLVIDNVSYLVKTNRISRPTSLPKRMGWSAEEDHNVMLVLCGSLISMMKKHTCLRQSAYMAVERHAIIDAALQFTDVYAAQNLSFEQAVGGEYAIAGGVPKYMGFSRRTSRWVVLAFSPSSGLLLLWSDSAASWCSLLLFKVRKCCFSLRFFCCPL